MQTQKSIVAQGTVEPVLRINPFAESVQRLHRDNLRVAEVCFRMSVARVEEYNLQKQKYWSEVQPKEDRIKQISRLQQEKHKNEQSKRIQTNKNGINLNQLQLPNTHKQQLAENKKQKISQRLKFTNLIADYTFAYRREKQNSQLQRSINLLAEKQQKIRKANFRRWEITRQIKQALKQQNKSVLLIQQSNLSQDIQRQQKCYGKLVKKWQTANRFYTDRIQAVNKKGDELKKKLNRLQQQHQNKHASLDQKRESNYQKDIVRQQNKIEKANEQRQRQLITLSHSISTDRQLKQERISCNKLSIRQQQQKRAAACQQKQHRSQVYLMQLNQEKQLLRSRNLHELTMTLRH